LKKEETMTDQLKKPYVKPQVTQVALRPGEAVLGGCKSSTMNGPNGAMCTNMSCVVIAS
jgi:hypothetical protein